MRCSAGSPAGHSRAEALEVAVAPDHPAGQQHRAAGAVALLAAARRRRRSCTRLRGGRQPGHAGPGHDQVRHRASSDQSQREPGLCSTYSSLMRSGPHTKTANVFAASRTSATRARGRAPPRGAPAPESTSSAMWFSSGRSVSAVGPASSATCLSPTCRRSSARGEAERREALALARAGRGRAAPRGRCRTRRRCRSPRPDPCRGPPAPRRWRRRRADVSTASPLGSAASARSRSDTRSTTRTSAPGSRGPSAANSVSLPRRASDAHEREGVRALDTCIPRCSQSEVRERVAVGDPEGDVVEGGRFHRPGVYSPLARSRNHASRAARHPSIPRR